MLQVLNVVADEVFESDSFAFAHRSPGELMKIVPGSRLGESLLGHVGHQMQQMQIVMPPKLDELRPRLIIIALHSHPVVLLISRKDVIVRELRAYEPLVIVGGGID